MIDFSRGDMGASPALDPWDPNNSAFNSTGGMHMFGGTNGNMPGVRTMFGSDSQMYYSTPSITPAMSSIRRPEYATADLEFAKFVRHGIIGHPYAMGQSRENMDLAAEEQKNLFLSNVGFNASSLAVAGGTLMSANPLAIAGGMVVSGAIDHAKETYFDNYKRTSKVSGITNKHVASDGTKGASKEDLIDMTKFLGKMAADDPLLEIEDMMNIMSTANSTGMLNADSSVRDTKRTLKGITDNLKSIADMVGSSDYKGIMMEMKKFQQLGFSDSATKKIIGSQTFSADIAGVSRSLVQDFNNSAMMTASTQTKSAGAIATNLTENLDSMRFMQQRFDGTGSGRLRDDSTFLSASENLERKTELYNERTGGLTSNKKVIFAEFKSMRTGRSVQEEVDILESMNKADQTSAIHSLGRDMSGEDRELYNTLISNRDSARAHVSNNKELNSVSTESSTMGMIKSAIKYIEDKNKKKTRGSFEAFFADNNTGAKLSNTEMELLVNKAMIESDPTMKREYENNVATTERLKETKKTRMEFNREKEKTFIGYKKDVTLGRIQDAWRNIVGGFSSAANTNERELTSFGNNALVRPYNPSIDRAMFDSSIKLFGLDKHEDYYEFNGDKGVVKSDRDMIGKNSTRVDLGRVKYDGKAILKNRIRTGMEANPLSAMYSESEISDIVNRNSSLYYNENSRKDALAGDRTDFDAVGMLSAEIEIERNYNQREIDRYSGMRDKDKDRVDAITAAISPAFKGKSMAAKRSLAVSLVDGRVKDKLRENTWSEGSTLSDRDIITEGDAVDALGEDSSKVLDGIMKYIDGDESKATVKALSSVSKRKYRENEMKFLKMISSDDMEKRGFAERDFMNESGISINRAKEIALKSGSEDAVKNVMKIEEESLKLTYDRDTDVFKGTSTKRFHDQNDEYKNATRGLTSTLNSISDPENRRRARDKMKEIIRDGDGMDYSEAVEKTEGVSSLFNNQDDYLTALKNSLTMSEEMEHDFLFGRNDDIDNVINSTFNAERNYQVNKMNTMKESFVNKAMSDTGIEKDKAEELLRISTKVYSEDAEKDRQERKKRIYEFAERNSISSTDMNEIFKSGNMGVKSEERREELDKIIKEKDDGDARIVTAIEEGNELLKNISESVG